MRRITITASTIGKSNPAELEERKNYRWNGDPAMSEAAREASAGRAHGITQERAKRLEEFAGYLDQGLTAAQAGRLLGIKPSTARHYERDIRRQRQHEETADA